MHLIRTGAACAEKPVDRVDDERYVDLPPDVVTDFDEAFCGSGGLDRIRPVVTGRAEAGQVSRFAIVHHLSQFLVLDPGDLIDTGPPPGVGMGLTPPVWPRAGDVVELGIRNHGTQRQHVLGPR
ncbi:fumarylacetoacetate hydrolase family protein [Streptomyces sp. NPDC050287]|uniref:fumarylacetoacetate hydrolase family protein n=1 Tax=Streptomyces sp. NPDC050287 TaxID=3365608 RepID=UPI003797019A